MKISSGMSEIILSQELSRPQGSGKAYLWPKINEKPVEPVRKVTRQTEGNIIYRKATEEEQEKVLASVRQETGPRQKTSGFSTGNFYPPGTLFDALV